MLPTIITAGVVVAVAFNMLKDYIELVVPPVTKNKDGKDETNRLHDATLRLVVVAIGIVVGFGQLALGGGAWSWHAATQAIIDGAQVGLASILVYHLVPGDFMPTASFTSIAGAAPATGLLGSARVVSSEHAPAHGGLVLPGDHTSATPGV